MSRGRRSDSPRPPASQVRGSTITPRPEEAERDTRAAGEVSPWPRHPAEGDRVTGTRGTSTGEIIAPWPRCPASLSKTTGGNKCLP